MRLDPPPRAPSIGLAGREGIRWEDGPPLINPFVSITTLAAGLRRRWRLAAAGMVLGMTAGLALSLVFPPAQTASATLFLHHPALTDPTRAIATEAQLLDTRAVAQVAVRNAGLGVSPDQLIKDYEPIVLTTDLLRIRVRGPNEAEAVRRADAVALGFLSFRAEELKRQAGLAVVALQAQMTKLGEELAAVTDRINSLSAGNQSSDVRELAELSSRRTTLGGQVSKLREQIEARTAESERLIQQSRVIDPAAPDERSPIKQAATNLIAGTIFGLFLGAGWIVLQEVVTSRVRRREDVTTLLQAPVAVSMGRLPDRIRSGRRRFRQQLLDPKRDVVRALGHLRRVLGRCRTAKPALVVVSVDSDGAGALAVAWLAVELMREDRRLLVVDMSRRNSLRMFRPSSDNNWDLRVPDAICGPWGKFPPSYIDDNQRVEHPELYRKLVADADVVLALATLDPALGAEGVAEISETAVAFVTAGRSTEAALRSTCQMLRAAQIHLDSVVVVDADPADRTVGLREPPPTTPTEVAQPLWINR